MASLTTAKFEAAVTVIRSLPKNGPFQPSYDMMKRFYGLFKQATEGPCAQPKPAFWNVVQTQKWQAWSALGDMDGEEAKKLYVDELLKIIETIPQTDDVVSFLKIIGPFFELITAEQAKAAGNQVSETNDHAKQFQRGASDKGEHSGEIPNEDDGRISQLPNGHIPFGGSEDSRPGGAETSNGGTEELSTRREQEEEINEGEMTENRFVMVESSQREEDSAELSHPILISKSQLGAAEEQCPVSSESESDGEEFCDSVDEPVLSTMRLHHSSVSESSPSTIKEREEEEEEEEEVHRTSTPFNAKNVVVTEAQIHNNKDTAIVPHYTISTSSTPILRGGGDVNSGTPDERGHGSSRPKDQSGQSLSKGKQSGSYQTGQSLHGQDGINSKKRGTTGGREGGGGGSKKPSGGGSPLRSPIPDDVVEQITMLLERLQRDMNSVLVRLNTLETIAISRHQIETQQAYMRDGIPLPEGVPAGAPSHAPSWWPFTIPFKTVLIFLVWPFIVNWIMRFLARHRRSRLR